MMMTHNRSLPLLIVVVAVLAVTATAIRPNIPAATPRARIHPTFHEDSLPQAQAPPAPTPTPVYVPMKPFPAQFTSNYQRYYTDFIMPQTTTGVIYQDQFNQRCRMTSVSTKRVPNSYLNIEQLAYFKPPGAQPDTAQASLLTLFNYGTQ